MNKITTMPTLHNNIRAKIFFEKVKLLYKNSLISIPANLICAFTIFIVLSETHKSRLAFIWFITVIFVSFFRLAAYYFYLHTQKYISLHLYIFIFGLAISAALWGFAGSILMPVNHLPQQMVLIVVIAGVTAGGVQTLNANLLASLIYVSLIIVPLTIWLYLESGLTYLALGIAMTAYLLFMLIVSIRGNNLLNQVLALKYENIELVNDLSLSNKKLMQSYKNLEEHEHEMILVNKMNDMLQICQKSSEAYDIILFTAKELFAEFTGGLAIFNPSTNTLETVKQWGNEQTLKSIFTAKDCWALRKRRSYLISNPTNELKCNHFNSFPGVYLCSPLILESGIIGLFVLHPDVKNNFSDHKMQLAISFCEVIQLSLANIKLRETLYIQSIHDPLTGLFNRRYLDETLSYELRYVIQNNKSLCVAMLDVDFFKRFNDINGHEAGDEVLKFIGSLLNENFRERDISCRYGGEEFLIVLVNSTLSDAYKRLEFIRIAAKAGKIYFRDQILPPITISVGIAEAPKQAMTVKDIIRAADEALYAAKKSGRDKVIINPKNSVIKPTFDT